MDNRRILIANLSKGVIGEQSANLIGSLLVSHVQLVAIGRSVLPEHERVPFFVHVDEFQSFGTDAFAALMSDARKYGPYFCLSHQFADQIAPHVRSAILGNAGLLVVFRVGGVDAELLAPEFHPIEANTLADQLPFKSWLRGAPHIPAATRSIARRAWSCRASGWRRSGRRVGGISGVVSGVEKPCHRTKSRRLSPFTLSRIRLSPILPSWTTLNDRSGLSFV